jgi:hypothetical protein
MHAYVQYFAQEVTSAWRATASPQPANPHLPKNVVADLVKTHVLTLQEVIDVQASGDLAQTYVTLRHAADHTAMIANQLADAVAKQFPATYAI